MNAVRYSVCGYMFLDNMLNDCIKCIDFLTCYYDPTGITWAVYGTLYWCTLQTHCITTLASCQFHGHVTARNLMSAHRPKSFSKSMCHILNFEFTVWEILQKVVIFLIWYLLSSSNIWNKNMTNILKSPTLRK